jgi:aconitate hydratase
MGVLPLQFQDGENADCFGLDGSETFDIGGIADLEPRQNIEVKVTRADGTSFTITARCRIDTYNELEYYRSGGILQFVLRKLAA